MKKNQIRKSVAALAMAAVVGVSLFGYGCGAKPASTSSDAGVSGDFTGTAKGYGGDVSVMTAVNTDGTVSGTAILDVSNETPGLGQNAAKEGFYSQFKGLKKGISLLKNGADGEKNEINAVTGATITSAAVTRAVNAALDDFDKVREAESGEE